MAHVSWLMEEIEGKNPDPNTEEEEKEAIFHVLGIWFYVLLIQL